MMISKKKIDVLVTFYNQKRYVNECLQSIFNQNTEFGFNVIVGDDGSDDGTIEQVKYWIDKYPNQIYLHIQDRNTNIKYNAGSRASRNRLEILRMVKSDYFIFLDGDDYFTDRDKLQKQVIELEKKENSECIGCGHKVRMFHELDKSKFEYLPSNINKKQIIRAKKYWEKYYFHTDSLLFRSSCINGLDFELLEDVFNDNLITFCFIKNSSLLFLPEVMCDYRQNNDGIWAGQSQLVGIIRNLISYDMELKINPAFREESKIRHIADFMIIRKELKNSGMLEISEFYSEYAKKMDLPILQNLANGYLFNKSKSLDNLEYYSILMKFGVHNLFDIKNMQDKINKYISKFWRK